MKRIVQQRPKGLNIYSPLQGLQINSTLNLFQQVKQTSSSIVHGKRPKKIIDRSNPASNEIQILR